jgi:hypothetical protein
MVNTRNLDREGRAKIWLQEIRPALTSQFVEGKKRNFGEIGEVIEGMRLCIFGRKTLDVMGSEPMISEYGIGLPISMFPYPYGDYKGKTIPRNSNRTPNTHYPFMETNHPFAKNQYASLPLYVFGVSLMEFPLSGFLTFYKILFNDKKFVQNELFSRGNDMYNRSHSDFTLANIAICNNLHNEGEWRFEDKKYSFDNTFASITRHFEYDEIDEMASLTWDEFEKIGEMVTDLEKTIPRKKMFGLF